MRTQLPGYSLNQTTVQLSLAVVSKTMLRYLLSKYIALDINLLLPRRITILPSRLAARTLKHRSHCTHLIARRVGIHLSAGNAVSLHQDRVDLDGLSGLSLGQLAEVDGIVLAWTGAVVPVGDVFRDGAVVLLLVVF